jgi:hypothetical protein
LDGVAVEVERFGYLVESACLFEAEAGWELA